MLDIDKIKNYKHIHMIGIGGISMSGIAEILTKWGYTVTGSDSSDSEITKMLLSHGLDVTIGHNIDNVSKADLIIYTASIQPNDIELVKARELNIPTVDRATFLGYLTKMFENTICISGTHGKTTTTSMISVCFLQACLNPTIQVGAILKQLNGNYSIGTKKHFILEACEYVDSFLKFFPTAAIVLNIDNDHLDYFKNFDNIVDSFTKFVKLLPEGGILVINADDENCLKVSKSARCNCITYGINTLNADFTAKNITFTDNGFASFDVLKKGEFFEHLNLSVPGKHNVLNALACTALCDFYGISNKDIQKGLLDYTGAHRRFEFKGSVNNITVYDDYAHHPTEIDALSNSLNNKRFNESWVIFQPHTYSRTKNLLNEFAYALSNFDNIIVTDIYAAREANTYGVTSKDLVDKLLALGKDAKYISNFNDIAEHIKKNAKKDDIVVTLGAGTITDLGKIILN